MTKRNAIAVLAMVLGAVACERASTPVSSGSGARPTAPRDYSSTGNNTTATGSPAIAVASVRRNVPGLYIARGTSTTSSVYLMVRRNSSVLGFSSLTSGTWIADDENSGPLEFSFSTSSGYRYLVVAVPVENGVADFDRASFVEFTT
jgi:hypothetical protein